MSAYNPQIKAYSLARAEAVRRLIATHSDEFNEIFREQKIAHGVTPRRPKADRIAELEQRIAKLKGQL